MGDSAGEDGAALSAFLIVKDEAARLPRTLAALAGLADQVVVVDSGSSDATVEIARAAGAEVHRREWEGYGPQKRFAEDLCRHAWRLNVDADEVVTEALSREIRALLAGGPATARSSTRLFQAPHASQRPVHLAAAAPQAVQA